MGKSWSRALGFGLLSVVAVAAAGCGQIGMLKAKMAFKDANALYQGQDYRAAAAKYEEVLDERSRASPTHTSSSATATTSSTGR